VAIGPVHEVLAGGQPASLIVRASPPDRALDTLQAAGFEASMERDHLLVRTPPEDASIITRTLAGAGLYVSELRPQEVSLEDVFLELTKDATEEEPK
jgi:ABC-2 type transport system ATP-binding protein